MKTTILTLNEILQLDSELSGFVNPQTQEVLLRGLINQKIPMTIKFHLRTLSAAVKDHAKNVQELREEMIKTLGTKNADGSIVITQTISKEDKSAEPNPAFIEFNKQLSELLSQTKEINHYDFKISDFKDVVTEESYGVFDKLISEENL